VRWAFPWAFAALVPLLAILWWRRHRREFRAPGLGYSATGWLGGRGHPPRWPGWLMALGLVALTVALARPQEGLRERELRQRGVDIVLAIDVSTSMEAEDFQPDNRLAVAKRVAEDFIRNRPHDRMGVVAFAATAFTQCPLTLNHDVLISLLRQLDFGMVEDGTAIGMGLATAVNRLRQSTSRSKVVVLLTDGINNRGAVDPLTAAELARAMGIRVYTIGVGTTGMAPFPVDDPQLGRRYERIPVEIDESVLRDVSRRTGGRYFRARDARALASIYRDIDRLERSEISDVQYEEWLDFGPDLCALAFVLLVLGWAAGLGRFARVP
jgi:Ca-activated chloride channel family protein